VHIHRLRRKLEGSGIEIRTVRGLGYLLAAERSDGRPG
jgi:DNA-binding response OmpR family regulator